ncbi:MAG TPA: carboxypeptidase regulatory-like domain-containing protein [Casimicrobiaceae bacterium]|nr:carboxypeptidase regulatory-like domain-containing protein [Casimicrobiaceae bacterium]
MGGRAHAELGAAIALMVVTATAGVAQATPVPKPVRQGDATYVNGGIGQTEADAIRHMASKWPLEMTFSEHHQGRDEFVAGVTLRVAGKNGRTVVDVHDGGPLLLLKLPEGRYTVKAEYDGQVKTKRVDIAAGQHDSIAFLWS